MSAAQQQGYDEDEARRRTDIFRRALSDLATFCGLLQILAGDDTRGGYGERVPMRLSTIQRLYVQQRTGMDVVLKARRVFITTVVCAENLLFFLTRRGASVGIVIPSETNDKAAREIERSIDIMLGALRAFVPHVSGIGPDQIIKTTNLWTWAERDSQMRIVKAGASKRTAENVGRAQRFNRLHFSEVASYPEGEAMFASILGAMPPTGGQVVLESTPKGAAGFFYDHWQDATLGSRRYRPHFYPWFAHDSYRLPLAPGEIIRPQGKLAELEVRLLEAGVTGDRIKWYRSKLDDLKGDVERLKQEYPNDPESCFLGSGDQYIPNTLIEACMHYDPFPSFDGPTFGGVDFGRTNDLTSIITCKQDRAGRLWVMDVETCRRTDWDTQIATILANAHNWGWKRCAVDATGMGSMPAEQLAKALGERRVDQVQFQEGVKEALATGGFAAIGERMLRLPDDPALINDIRAIQRIVEPSGKIKYDAPRTRDGHADRAWALFLAIMAAGGIDVPHPTKQELGAGDFANPYRTTTR